MSAIAYFLELEGLQTTGISLVRENTEALKPPRFLWTSFPLGRPLGKPADPAFQHRVIRATLGLLERVAGPVLEDYPEDVPEISNEESPACPISFARPAGTPGSWHERLQHELMLVSPWYEISVRRRGRTTMGIAKASVEELIGRLARALDDPISEAGEPRLLKYALEDLKTFYQEALTAQPGNHNFRTIERILWRETELGHAMLALHDRFSSHPNPQLRGFARGIAPRGETQRTR